jgi:hypothetical protein
MNTEFNTQHSRKQQATSWASRVGAIGATAMFVVTTAGASTAMPPPPDPINPPTGGSHEARLIERPCFNTPHDWDYAGAGPIPVCHIEF